MHLYLAILLVCLAAHAGADNELQCGQVDLIFAADRSGSVGADNYQKMKEFMSNVVNSFVIHPNEVQVGVTTYSNWANHDIELTEFQYDKDDLKDHILNHITPYSGGVTNTADAINKAMNMFNNHGRSTAEKVLVILTDGKPCCEANSVNDAINAAVAAKNAGIKVFAVGIGDNIDFDTLEQLACSPDRVFQPCGFSELGKIVNRLAGQACGAFERVDCDPWVYYNAHSYKFCRTKVNYWTAKEVCEHYDAYVVEVNDVGENIFVSDLIGCSRWRYAFLGAYSHVVWDHQFFWETQGAANLFYPCDNPPNCAYEMFAPGQPDNENWDRCIQLDLNDPNNGRWEDINCWRWRTFVCERDCCAPQPVEEEGE